MNDGVPDVAGFGSACGEKRSGNGISTLELPRLLAYLQVLTLVEARSTEQLWLLYLLDRPRNKHRQAGGSSSHWPTGNSTVGAVGL